MATPVIGAAVDGHLIIFIKIFGVRKLENRVCMLPRRNHFVLMRSTAWSNNFDKRPHRMHCIVRIALSFSQSRRSAIAEGPRDALLN